MYAAVGVWNMEAGDWEEEQRGLHEEIVPMVRQIPGFVAGYWMGDQAASKTYTTIVWEDEEAAQRFKEFVLGAGRQGRQDEAGVSNESMTVVEVLPRRIADPVMERDMLTDYPRSRPTPMLS